MNRGGMRCSVLASGSTGNAVYVEAGKTRVLIDAGIGIRQLCAAFDEIAVGMETLDAVIVTHEHSDHIKGLSALVRRRAGLPIYTSEGTWSHLRRFWRDDETVVHRIVRAATPIALGELVLEPFPLPHDAEEPLGFCLYAGGEKLVLATDLGYASAAVKDVVKGAHTYILETNHDVEMLRVGAYPWHLKRRILGDKGHLSNDSASEFLCDILTEDTTSVYLAHLSQENNRPELADATVSQALLRMSSRIREQIAVSLTSPTKPTKLTWVAAPER